MDSFNLTLAQAWTVINALHTAAEAYEGFAKDAELAKDAETAVIGADRLAAQFRKQAQHSLALAALIAKA